jgi:hypothetical protein
MTTMMKERMARNGAKGTRVEKILVTPEIATKWLGTQKGNRPLSDARVKEYENEMRRGNWRLTHQGIAFDEDGKLVDGQHRLWAVIDSECSVPMFVAFDLSTDCVVEIDGGRPRNLPDRLGYCGIETSKSRVSIVRIMLLHYYTQQMGAADGEYSWARPKGMRIRTETVATFHELVKPAVDFAINRAGSGKGKHACVCAAVACAWYTQDHGRLEAFQQILQTGEVHESYDNAAIKFRDFLLKTGLTSGGESARKEIFLRASTALRAFCEHRQIARLYAIDTAPFPLPHFRQIVD